MSISDISRAVLPQQQVADETTAHPDQYSDDGDAQQIQASLTLEAGGEHRPLDAAEADSEQIGPERNGEERFGHASILP